MEKAVDVIMQTIHIASVSIAERYEDMITDAVGERIRIMKLTREEVGKFTGENIKKKLDELKGGEQ